MSAAVTDYDGKLWVLGGCDSVGCAPRNDAWWTVDGSSWFLATDTAPWQRRFGHAAVNYDGKLWVLGGLAEYGHTYFYDAWYTADGASWSLGAAQAGWSRRGELSAVVHNQKMWVLAGGAYYDQRDDVWSSRGTGVEEYRESPAELDMPMMWPNPARRTTTALVHGRDVVLSVCDAAGRVALSLPTTAGRATFDVSRLRSGVYLVGVRGNLGYSRLVVAH
jgi:hypothetical protein